MREPKEAKVSGYPYDNNGSRSSDPYPIDKLARDLNLDEVMIPRDPNAPEITFADIGVDRGHLFDPNSGLITIEVPDPSELAKRFPAGRAEPWHQNIPYKLLPDGTVTVDEAASVAMPFHNKYCRDDWAVYQGAGPRGMGAKNDGCVCELEPPGYDEELVKRILDSRAPRLWDSEPDGVTHIAGSQLNMFGIFLRQRCEWCGIVLIEYDLRLVAVQEGSDGPSMYPINSLVRVDGHISAVIDNPEILPDGGVQLPPDACAFNPLTQVGR